MQYFFSLILISFLALESCKAKDNSDIQTVKIQLVAARVGTFALDLNKPSANEMTAANKEITLDFSVRLDTNTAKTAIRLLDIGGKPIASRFAFLNESQSVSLFPLVRLANLSTHEISVSNNLKGFNKETFAGTAIRFTTAPASLQVDSLLIEGKKVGSSRITNVDFKPQIVVYFSDAIQESTINSAVVLTWKGGNLPFTQTLDATKKILTLVPNTDLDGFWRYTFQINSNLKGALSQVFGGLNQYFYTKPSFTDKFPSISDNELLNLVQKQTLKYFYDFAHPVSGMAPERNSTPQIVTVGGSGFGVMSLIVGVERGFISRNQGLERWTKILNFLKTADRFHGAWSHWMDGATGKTIAFSPDDNGGDLVETSFMVQGLITLRQYLNKANPTENDLVVKIDSLCNAIEWDWYRQNNQEVLYWHWSPTVAWKMNHKLQGWNETLITYVLAASSPTHSIPKSVYSSGFATGGDFRNGQTYFGINLPLGPALGGPLFFTHYSFLGLKPNPLSDAYANYWTQNVNHSKINHAYCLANPKKFVGYGPDCWGLTASDNEKGYSAHSPTNDLGVISPTAALSSFPYTTTESMQALKFFYYKLGDRLWGDYGFYDAFNPTNDWYARSYLAIDQGPIVVMMENYRTGLLWNLFMSAPEVQQGLTKLGFQN